MGLEPVEKWKNNPGIGPGCPYFDFLSPEIAEFSRVSGCRTRGYGDNITNREVSRMPYFIQQIGDIPPEGTLSATFSARFHGKVVLFEKN